MFNASFYSEMEKIAKYYKPNLNDLNITDQIQQLEPIADFKIQTDDTII